MKKLIITLTAIVILGISGAIIKFVVSVAPGKSVIKRYSYSGNVKDLIFHVKAFSTKDTSVAFKITDTTDTNQTGYRFYIDIDLKNDGRDIIYSIACEADGKNTTSKTEVELVMAYDKTNGTGGYNKDAKGVSLLVTDFDMKFIVPFKNTENVIITALE